MLKVLICNVILLGVDLSVRLIIRLLLIICVLMLIVVVIDLLDGKLRKNVWVMFCFVWVVRLLGMLKLNVLLVLEFILLIRILKFRLRLWFCDDVFVG